MQCIVTSPPYWGLRKYAGEQELVWGPEMCFTTCDGPHPDHEFIEEHRAGISGGQNNNCKADNPEGPTNRDCPPSTHGTCRRCGAWRGAYGLEPSVQMYVAHSLEILGELRRVLRADGVLFWNLGDSYQSGNRGNYMRPRCTDSNTLQAAFEGEEDFPRQPNRLPQDGLKPKDLVLMPARIALAAQADGWWVRSVIVWAKPNPMPESVADRPTDSYEQILMLTKSARYFWDADAVREAAAESSIERMSQENFWNQSGGEKDYGNGSKPRKIAENVARAWGYKPGHDERDGKERFCSGTGGYVPIGGRNMRNVWDFPTQPYAGAHFATFPEELPRRCILAATSARGSCRQCGAPWERVVKATGGTIGHSYHDHQEDEVQGQRTNSEMVDGSYQRDTVGWTPTCRCRGQHGQTAPCVVLDPFGGSGTTGRVAIELGRRAVLLDLAYSRETADDRQKGRSYATLARRRTNGGQMAFPLL